MSERTIEALLADVTPALRGVLRRAYETGFREGIAEGGARGESRAPGAEGHVPDAGSPVPSVGQNAAQRLVSDAPPTLPEAQRPAPLFAWDQDSATDDEGDDDRADDTATHRKHHRRRVGIRTTSTIGYLKKKIEKEFRLERFSIDVIIARTGDRDRRQLPSHVKLAAYLREE